MQKIKLALLMTGICVHSFFVKAETPPSPLSETTISSPNDNIASVYNQIDFKGAARLNPEVFSKAYIGYLNLMESGQISNDKHLLSICDYSLSANTKRLWVIDMDHLEVRFHSLVAHGQGTGEEFATQFSNRENSHQSSLGFYITDETYIGSNGYSLRLHGKDKGYNSNAYDRAIVMHGADYVSEKFIKGNKRLGRSWGCPAVPQQLALPIINTIKEGSCLFVYYPNNRFNQSSNWLAKMPKQLQTGHPDVAQTLSKKVLAMATTEGQDITNDVVTAPGTNGTEQAPAAAAYGQVKLALPQAVTTH